MFASPPSVSTRPVMYRNLELSLLFKQMADVYESAPLCEDEKWHSYTYNVVSGRLRHLDFDVKSDPNALESVKLSNDSDLLLLVISPNTF